MSRLLDFISGVPPSTQAPRGGEFWLRHNLKKKALGYSSEEPIAPYSDPGKGVSGESTNSAGDSTWGSTTGQSKVS